MKGQVNCIKIKQKNNQSILNSIEIPQGGNNAYSGAKKGVQCSDSNILYLAFISGTFLKNSEK